MEYEIFPYQFDSYTEETTLRSQVVEGDQGSRTKTDMLRVDHLIDSRHKYLSPDPQTVVVEHEGEEYQLALPKNSPACDFLLSAVTGDFLFLIGSQHPGRDGETYRGALVVARRREDGIYATELWHETHLSFVMRVGAASCKARRNFRKSRSGRDSPHDAAALLLCPYKPSVEVFYRRSNGEVCQPTSQKSECRG